MLVTMTSIRTALDPIASKLATLSGPKTPRALDPLGERPDIDARGKSQHLAGRLLEAVVYIGSLA